MEEEKKKKRLSDETKADITFWTGILSFIISVLSFIFKR